MTGNVNLYRYIGMIQYDRKKFDIFLSTCRIFFVGTPMKDFEASGETFCPPERT
jgi:hypothetical protein